MVFKIIQLIFLSSFVYLPLVIVSIKNNLPLQTTLRNVAKAPSLVTEILEQIRQSPDAIVQEKDKDGCTLTHIACMSKCSAEIIQALLSVYPESSIELDRYNQLPLHYLFDGKKNDIDLSCLMVLLNHRVSSIIPPTGIKDRSGRLPLHHAAGATSLQSLNVIQALLSSYPEAASIEDSNGHVPVRYAIDENAPQEIVELLLQAYPKGAHTLLISALTSKNWDKAEQLIRKYPAAAGVRSKNGKILPLGVAMSKKAPYPVVQALLDAHPASVQAEKSAIDNFDFYEYFSSIFQQSPTDAANLLSAVLPINRATGEEYENHLTGYWWTFVLSQTQDKYHEIVDQVLLSCASCVQILANTHDELGRRAVDIATPMCRQHILSRLNFYRRYELRPGSPEHQSATCIVRFATDHVLKKEVALKFMRFRDHFEREILCRRMLSQSTPPMSTAVLESNVSMVPLGLDALGVTDSDRYVVSVLHTHDSDADAMFKHESEIKGYGKYPYCMVMPAAERSLASIMTHENIAGKDWRQIRLIMESITEFIVKLHELGFMHGDLKPLNIVRDGGRMKCIDLDASVSFVEKQFAGVKVSSAFAPPEMVQLSSKGLSNHATNDSPPVPPIPASATAGVDAQGVIDGSNIISNSGSTIPTSTPRRRAFVRKNPNGKNKSPGMNMGIDVSDDRSRGDPPSDETVILLPASPSYDLWSLGVLFFELCTGEPLFLADEEGNIDEDDLLLLRSWSNDLKKKKLVKVKDPVARHLLSQLLTKDPTKRPSAKRVLTHPFITGKKAFFQRLTGESAEYDVFLSYRVASDAENAERLYRRLTDRGLKVWYDQISLQPGVPWEEGFCEGMMKSRAFVPLLSRRGLANFEHLNEGSSCDNVLLEYRLAQELRVSGFIEKIYPVMIGDREEFLSENNGELPIEHASKQPIKHTYLYSDYIESKCYPMKPATTTVLSLENKLRAYLEQTSLGSPFMENRSVASILSDIMAHQGGFVKGRLSVLQYPPLSTPPSGMSSVLDPPPLSDDAFTNVVDSIVRMVTDDRYNDSPLNLSSSISSSSDDDEEEDDDVNDGDDHDEQISIIKNQIEDLQITLNNLLLRRNNNVTHRRKESKYLNKQ